MKFTIVISLLLATCLTLSHAEEGEEMNGLIILYKHLLIC